MAALRGLILENDASFAAAQEAVGQGFAVSGEVYKRTRHPGQPEALRLWLCLLYTSVAEFDQPLGMLPEQEAEELLALLKKTLSGKRGRTLTDIEFSS